MSNHDFLWVIALGSTLVFFLIATVRKRQPLPSRLHLKSQPLRDLGSNSVANMDMATREVIKSSYTKTRELNVVFMYNGHSWDAYEVLGVPAGASLDLVERAYRASLIKTQPESHEFINCAYRAIKSQ